MTVLVHAIMCGGSGTRLWPWSRRSHPKQFLTLIGERSLLQTTVERLAGLSVPVDVLAIGNEEHRFLIAEQLHSTEATVREIVLEPAGRNTAPVAIIAALRAQAICGNEALVLVSAADHFIADPAAYREAIERAMPIANAGRVVVFGVQATRPETGYGYIELGAAIAAGVRGVASFREKPDAEAAKGYAASKRFVWNAGIFLWRADHLLAIAERMQPDILGCCRRICAEATTDLDFFRLPRELFLTIPPISFDVAFMEQLQDQGAVVPVDIGWSDIGSWDSMKQVLAEKDVANVTRGPVELFDCDNVLALSDGPLIVGHGLSDALVVASQDAIYVACAGESDKIRGIVAQLERHGREEAVRHKREFRPWGWYQTINFGERFRVKEIVVKPGGKLSLQSHHHRAEHWVVVRGAATVTIEDKTTLVAENQSVYIPLGSKHRLENAGKIAMHLIEVQTGSYLEEDDIIRHEDQYGRS